MIAVRAFGLDNLRLAVRPLARWLTWLGGALMLCAAVFAAHSWLLARPQQRALATVLDNAESFAPAGGVLYTPRLRLRTASGTIVQILAAPGSDEPEFAPGETLPVFYPTGQPQQAKIATTWRVYRTAIIFAILGVILFDIGLLLRLILRPRP